jgi:hypothetical protein
MSVPSSAIGFRRVCLALRQLLGRSDRGYGLSALWDTFATVRRATFVEFLSVELLSLLVAVISLMLLLRRVREARRAAVVSREEQRGG